MGDISPPTSLSLPSGKSPLAGRSLWEEERRCLGGSHPGFGFIMSMATSGCPTRPQSLCPSVQPRQTFFFLLTSQYKSHPGSPPAASIKMQPHPGCGSTSSYTEGSLSSSSSAMLALPEKCYNVSSSGKRTSILQATGFLAPRTMPDI